MTVDRPVELVIRSLTAEHEIVDVHRGHSSYVDRVPLVVVDRPEVATAGDGRAVGRTRMTAVDRFVVAAARSAVDLLDGVAEPAILASSCGMRRRIPSRYHWLRSSKDLEVVVGAVGRDRPGRASPATQSDSCPDPE